MQNAGVGRSSPQTGLNCQVNGLHMCRTGPASLPACGNARWSVSWAWCHDSKPACCLLVSEEQTSQAAVWIHLKLPEVMQSTNVLVNNKMSSDCFLTERYFHSAWKGKYGESRESRCWLCTDSSVSIENIVLVSLSVRLCHGRVSVICFFHSLTHIDTYIHTHVDHILDSWAE